VIRLNELVVKTFDRLPRTNPRPSAVVRRITAYTVPADEPWYAREARRRALGFSGTMRKTD